MHQEQEDITPRIYVACLSAYNNSKLHGAWINCNQDAEAIWKEINKMLSNSPEPDAEEWAIHDFDNWQGMEINEYESVERIAELAQMLEEHGKAFAVYCNYYGSNATPQDFNDHYLGQYESEEDFVYEQWKEEGKLDQLEKMGIADSYINWQNIATDWFINSYHSVEVAHQEIYVFVL